MALTELFTSIADAIRSKDGTTDGIVASTFPQRILDIPSGGGNIQFSKSTFTPAENVSINGTYYYVNHSLGVIPDFVLIFCTSLTDSSEIGRYIFGGAILFPENSSVRSITSRSPYGGGSFEFTNKLKTDSVQYVICDSEKIGFEHNVNCSLVAGQTYEVIVGVVE